VEEVKKKENYIESEEERYEIEREHAEPYLNLQKKIY
jgi:hypothetical protein